MLCFIPLDVQSCSTLQAMPQNDHEQHHALQTRSNSTQNQIALFIAWKGTLFMKCVDVSLVPSGLGSGKSLIPSARERERGGEGSASRELADVTNLTVIIVSAVSLSFWFCCVIRTDRLRLLHNPPRPLHRKDTTAGATAHNKIKERESTT